MECFARMLVELEKLIREMPPSVQAPMGGQGIFSMGTFEGYIEQVVYSGFVQLWRSRERR